MELKGVSKLYINQKENWRESFLYDRRELFKESLLCNTSVYKV